MSGRFSSTPASALCVNSGRGVKFTCLQLDAVNRIFRPRPLARPHAAAPRVASCDQEGPAIAPRYLTAAIVSGAAVVSVDHEQKSFPEFCGYACGGTTRSALEDPRVFDRPPRAWKINARPLVF